MTQYIARKDILRGESADCHLSLMGLSEGGSMQDLQPLQVLLISLLPGHPLLRPHGLGVVFRFAVALFALRLRLSALLLPHLQALSITSYR